MNLLFSKSKIGTKIIVLILSLDSFMRTNVKFVINPSDLYNTTLLICNTLIILYCWKELNIEGSLGIF